ncbi:MAG: hypothetical protein ACLSAP_10350 [Oscillospiraceae bacterium]
MSQDPASGAQSQGSKVNLVISKGPGTLLHTGGKGAHGQHSAAGASD